MPTAIAGQYRWSSLDEQIEHYTYKDPMAGCWIWLGALNHGYAMARNVSFGKETKVHRMSYTYYRGPIPDGLHIDHLCRVRCCVNPWHLETVTFAENVRRGLPFKTPVSELRSACKRGHPFTEENTWIEIDTEGYSVRHCRECRRANNRRWWKERQCA